jgi:hypothetical protein
MTTKDYVLKLVKRKVLVKLPEPPSFIRLAGTGERYPEAISIADLSDTEIKAYAKAWTLALLEKAAKIRYDRDN